jgi:hypothetical protein
MTTPSDCSDKRSGKRPATSRAFTSRDPKTNKGLSITIYEDVDALRHAGAALAARPANSKVGIEPELVEFFQAISF